mgnify:CR=1 FL=1
MIYTGSPLGLVLASYDIPEDSYGPPRSSDVNVAFIGITDDIARLNARALTFQEDALSEFPLGQILTPTRTVQSAGFRSDGRAVLPGFIDYSIPTGVSVWFPLECLPHAANVTSIGVRIDPTNTTLPATNIGLQLYRVERSTGAQTLIGSVVDPAIGAAYQAPHELVLAVSASIDLQNFSYAIAITAEFGANADGFDLLSAPRVSYMLSALDVVR